MIAHGWGMAYSSLLTNLWRPQDPKWLWPCAGIASVLVHGLIWGMVRSLTVDITYSPAPESDPLPIQLVALPPSDLSEPTPAAESTLPPADAGVPPAEPESPAPGSEGGSTENLQPAPVESLPPTISPQSSSTPLPGVVTSPPVNAPGPTNPPEAGSNPTLPLPNPTISPPRDQLPAPGPSPPGNPQSSNQQVSPPPPGLNPQPQTPEPNPAVMPRPTPMVEPDLEGTAPMVQPAPSISPRPTSRPDPGVESPPLTNPEPQPPIQNPEPQPPTQNPEVLPPSPPRINTPDQDPVVTAPPTAEPPTEDLGNAGQDGRLSTSIRLNPRGRDIPEVAPQIQGSGTIAVQPLPPQCAVANLAALTATVPAATIQLQVRVEADGRISAAEVVQGNGSGNAALDNLVRCLVKERLSLAPASSGGQSIKTDAFILETRISF